MCQATAQPTLKLSSQIWIIVPSSTTALKRMAPNMSVDIQISLIAVLNSVKNFSMSPVGEGKNRRHHVCKNTKGTIK